MEWSWDSTVGTAIGYGLDDQGVSVRIPVGSNMFSVACRPALGPNQPPNQWVLGALSPGVKRPGHEADHSPPTSAEVKKTWIYTTTPHTSSWRSAKLLFTFFYNGILITITLYLPVHKSQVYPKNEASKIRVQLISCYERKKKRYMIL
jgi:hypothetical protein